MSFEQILTVAGFLLIASITLSKLLVKVGVPPLILFLLIGMLAGSEGIGNIYFDNVHQAKDIGIIALVFILFSGGLDTKWKSARSVYSAAFSLSTVGVVITTVFIAVFSALFLKFTLIEGLLLGAIVGSTDVAAVFSVLRSKNFGIRKKILHTVELESGINDPMAVFLTMAFIQIIKTPQVVGVGLVLAFVLQMFLGVVLGIVFGKILVKGLKHIKLESDGLYSVLTFSSVLLAYGVTSTLGGSGFLAVYILGLVLGNSRFSKNIVIKKFHEGVAGVMDTAMFLMLGLLVFPSQLIPVIIPGILVALFLMLIARPAGVFVSLLFSRFTGKDKVLVSWLGLKGAVPIILATFPLLSGVKGANIIFNIVFFVVLSSTLIQGVTITWLVKFLRIRKS